LTLPPSYRCPLDRLPASRLLLPRSALERSDFVLWHFSEVSPSLSDVRSWAEETCRSSETIFALGTERTSRTWPSTHVPRCAAVNSFAHLGCLECPLDQRLQRSDGRPDVIPSRPEAPRQHRISRTGKSRTPERASSCSRSAVRTSTDRDKVSDQSCD
jgi:hypothetical protein